MEVQYYFDQLMSGNADQKVDAFLEIQEILPRLVDLDGQLIADFETFGYDLSRWDTWSEPNKRKFIMLVIRVQSSKNLPR